MVTGCADLRQPGKSSAANKIPAMAKCRKRSLRRAAQRITWRIVLIRLDNGSSFHRLCHVRNERSRANPRTALDSLGRTRGMVAENPNRRPNPTVLGYPVGRPLV